ncbi:MAG: GreA/GreB family elongation factor [Candidatus Paceibacterota bacterium]
MNLFTRRSFNALEEQIRQTKKRLSVVRGLKAESFSGQDGYDDEGSKMFGVEEKNLISRVRELESIKFQSSIIEVEEQSEKIKIGNIVRLLHSTGSVELHNIEGYVFGGKNWDISSGSPLGSVLIGKKEGEKVMFKVGGEDRWAIILKIYPPSEFNSLLEEFEYDQEHNMK